MKILLFLTVLKADFAAFYRMVEVLNRLCSPALLIFIHRCKMSLYF